MQAGSGIMSNLTNQVTVHIVEQVSELTNSSILAGNPDDPVNRFNIHLPYGDGTIYWDFGDIDGSGRIATNWGAGTDEIHVWSFTASTISNEMTIYRDGNPIISGAQSNSITSSASLNIGVTGDNSGFFNGILSEIIVKNIEDSPDTIINDASALYSKWQTQ